VPGTLGVGFAFVPAGQGAGSAVGTLVPHEGGPGYSTTGTAADYAAMYGPLLRTRNLLLVDQRGTGLSAPVRCAGLQNLTGPYAPAAAQCARRLGDRFDLYGSALSADDLSAVISALRLAPVDLYGDSYGTFFAQVFAGRHPGQLRSVVLDSAYPTTGEDAWYATQGPAMRSSFGKVCARTPACAALGGSTVDRLGRLLDLVRRHPLHGRAFGADGVVHAVTIDAPTLVLVAFNATYGPATYREMDAAVRAALAGDAAPLSRLVAEVDFTGAASAPVDYSEGLDAAVSCQDYPQLYDMAASPARRLVQYRAAVAAEQQADPGVYGPFTVAEYLSSDWEEQDWCLRWPVASAAHAAGPPGPPAGHYAPVPVLVLSGELDSITTPAEGAMVAAQFPAARQVIIANSFHVTAVGDIDGCGQQLVRAFVGHPTAALPASGLACATAVPPLRASPTFTRSFTRTAAPVPGLRAAAAVTAADTVADLIDRWNQTYASNGGGLRGGTWTSSGADVVHLRLSGVRYTDDLAVSGDVTWNRYGHTVSVRLTLRQVDAAGRAVPGSVDGTVRGSWNSRASGAVAHLSGVLGGRSVDLAFPAP
jgi:pimeloyl-ACP methyl ester carboxylesterase